MTEDKPKKVARRRHNKRPTIFQTFCLALALENWDGASALIELDKKKGKIQSMTEAISILANKPPIPFPGVDAEFGSMLGPPDIDNPPSKGEKEK